MLRPRHGVAVLLTKDTQLLTRSLVAPWAAQCFQQPPSPPRMVMVGGMRAGLYQLRRSAAQWAVSI